MSRPVLFLGAALFLSALAPGCSRPAPIASVELDSARLSAETGTPAAPAPTPLATAVEATPDVQAPVMAAIEAVQTVVEPAPPLGPVDSRSAACRRAAAALIVRWEVTSERRYTRALRYPVWPGGASGVTWGIGYDGGHQTAAVIADDWAAHLARERLAQTAGLTGGRAKSVLPRYRDIDTPYGYAVTIFEERSLVEYERRTARAFREGFGGLRPNACAALVSLVYNRGAAMTGDSRREMRVLRDDCVPAQNYGCIAAEIRSMKRLWIGTPNERGLSARRESEAVLAETP